MYSRALKVEAFMPVHPVNQFPVISLRGEIHKNILYTALEGCVYKILIEMRSYLGE